ncbi:unnamed protein product, partial [Ectocarpus fasciculatus]
RTYVAATKWRNDRPRSQKDGNNRTVGCFYGGGRTSISRLSMPAQSRTANHLLHVECVLPLTPKTNLLSHPQGISNLSSFHTTVRTDQCTNGSFHTTMRTADQSTNGFRVRY